MDKKVYIEDIAGKIRGLTSRGIKELNKELGVDRIQLIKITESDEELIKRVKEAIDELTRVFNLPP